MAAITPSGVAPGAGATYFDGIAGGALTNGMACYLDTSTNTIKAADADAAASAACLGIATHAAASGQPIRLQKGGKMTIAASGIVKGTAYYVGIATAGDIVPYADIGSGDYPCLVGIGISATEIEVLIYNVGSAI